MKKLLKVATFLLVIYLVIWCGTVLSDRKMLNDNLIRLHVVANSDSEEDQALKLKVRDAVVEKLQETMESFPTMDEARQYLQDHLPELEAFVNQVIRELGFAETATVSVDRETFDTREYDTFTLPAGYYEALRITIGEGQGKNWWCVVFPSLCVGTTTEDFADTAVGAGFSDTLTETLQEEPEIRFFLLDLLGQVENFFRSL
ncbi:MAG: stage II sporulation protein R [Oscillospiraceae bacterium]|nr:stage II sporulation protein R [Oscillospiraceae bacterium]